MIKDHDLEKEAQRRTRDEQAPTYDAFLKSKGVFYTQLEWAYTQRGLNLSADDILFDAGCGTGRLTIPLAKQVKKVVCCDFSEKSLEILLQNSRTQNVTNIESHQLDLTQPLPFANQSFTKIYSNNVLPFIAPERQIALLQEFHRVLKPGGQLCIAMVYRLEGPLANNVKEGYFETASAKLYRYAFSLEDLSDRLRQAGFKIKKAEGLMSLPGRVGKFLSWVGLAPMADQIYSNFTSKTMYAGAIATNDAT